MSARFITLEGGEGTGKSTQCALLARRLADRGIACSVTREPGGSPFAEALRDLILSDALPPRAPLAEALLFLAARADHIEKRIAPELAAGRWVISDRYSDSTLVYQGVAGRVPMETLAAIDRIVVGPIRPHLTIILDLPAAEGLARAAARRQGTATLDPYEGRSLAYHEALRAGFRAIAEAEPDRCVLIAALGAPDDVAASIWSAIETRLIGPRV